MLGDPAARGELTHQRAIQLAPTVVEILKTGLTHFQLRFFEPALQRPILTREVLGIDEHAEALIEAEGRDRRIALLGEVDVGHRAEPEMMKAFDRLFSQHAAAPVGNRPARGRSCAASAVTMRRWSRAGGDRGRV